MLRVCPACPMRPHSRHSVRARAGRRAVEPRAAFAPMTAAPASNCCGRARGRPRSHGACQEAARFYTALEEFDRVRGDALLSLSSTPIQTTPGGAPRTRRASVQPAFADNPRR